MEVLTFLRCCQRALYHLYTNRQIEERMGFEPMDLLRDLQFSRLAQSTNSATSPFNLIQYVNELFLWSRQESNLLSSLRSDTFPVTSPPLISFFLFPIPKYTNVYSFQQLFFNKKPESFFDPGFLLEFICVINFTSYPGFGCFRFVIIRKAHHNIPT